MALKDLLAIFETVQKTDLSDLRTLAADSSLEKAVNDLKAGEKVHDLWEADRLHTAPPKTEIKVGPPQESSGGGAERMVKEYSGPAPQWPAITNPEHLAAYLGHLDSLAKANRAATFALIDAHSNLKKSVDTILETLTKGMGKKAVAKAEDEEEEDEEDEEEESEVVEINEKACKDHFAKARKLAKKLATLKADLEDLDGAELKAAKAEIKSLKKQAGKALAKARAAAFTAKGAGSENAAEFLKSIKTLAAKADINVVQEEEEEEEDDEEEGTEKAAPVSPVIRTAETASTEKATKDDKGNQADCADPKTGNQADHAKAVEDKLDKALSGTAMLEGKINQLFDVVMGKSKVSDLVPDIAKSVAGKSLQFGQIFADIESAADAGTLTQFDAMACEDIVQRIKAGMENGGDMTAATDRLKKTTTNARGWLQQRLELQAAA